MSLVYKKTVRDRVNGVCRKRLFFAIVVHWADKYVSFSDRKVEIIFLYSRESNSLHLQTHHVTKTNCFNPPSNNEYVTPDEIVFFLLCHVKVLKKNLSADALKFIIVEKKDEQVNHSACYGAV